MNAILLWKDVTNPDSIPGEWPAVVMPGISTAPDARPWIFETDAQLLARKQTYQSAYDSWLSSKATSEKSASDARIQEISDTIADFDLALTNWATLSAAQQKAVLRRCVVVLKYMLKEQRISMTL